MLAPKSVSAWIVIGTIAACLASLMVKGYGFGHPRQARLALEASG